MQREIEALLNAWLTRQEHENRLVQGLLSALAQSEVARHRLLHELSSVAALAMPDAAPQPQPQPQTATTTTDERLARAVEALRAAHATGQAH
jgi:hypothetical protein